MHATEQKKLEVLASVLATVKSVEQFDGLLRQASVDWAEHNLVSTHSFSAVLLSLTVNTHG